MLSPQPFVIVPNGTVSISANGTASSTAALNATSNSGFISCRVHNAGPALAFIEFGGAASVTAVTTTSMPVPVGALEVVDIGQATFAAAICASGSTATVYFSKGYGL